MQLFFLLYNDLTGYKLASNIQDLTSAQIYFYKLCAEIVQKEFNDAKSGMSSNTATTNKLNIDTTRESKESIQSKLDTIKSRMGR
jgi:hypothetical protein